MCSPITVVFVLLMAWPLGAQRTASLSVPVGGKRIVIVAPAGFSDASRSVPDLITQTERTTPTNRVLGAFAWDDDIRKARPASAQQLNRWLLVMVTRSIESSEIDDQTFNQVLAVLNRRPALGATQRETNERLGDLSGRKGLQIKEAVWVGRVFRKPDTAGYILLNNMASAGSDVTIVTGMAPTRVKNRLINLYVYRRSDPAAQEWVRLTLEKWASQVLAAN